MDKLYRIVVIRFDYTSAKCLFPIILNWEQTTKAVYEIEIMNKIIAELETALGVTKVRVVHNRISTYEDLKNEFNGIIGDINYNTPNSQLRTLSVDLKRFKPLTPFDIENGTIEKFELHSMHFPIKVNDPSNLTLTILEQLPMLVIEE
jgi:hypothetical protein